MNDKNIIQMPDGYLNKTPLFQFILLSGNAANLLI
ncbi:Uncharacterised protein [Shigella flexneri]|uniref:Uncharacterized protein n=1 Tax=Shigella flexneri TaxID=623 RepID=A0A379YYI5_SHIFL|nr:Uncharacterised protein [Shigella flexneri]SUI87896.1 Uncharacterised protein [Shigella flexneri]